MKSLGDSNSEPSNSEMPVIHEESASEAPVPEQLLKSETPDTIDRGQISALSQPSNEVVSPALEGLGKTEYKFKLEVFEGPLDLLLHLIRKNEIDIHDIPMESITRQYLDYINMMENLKIDLASEFLVTAATLVYIKSRMLLPAEKMDFEMEEEDPRYSLVQKLLEYRQFKESAGFLEKRQDFSDHSFTRGYFAECEQIEQSQDALKEVSVFDLVFAFQILLEKTEQKQPEAIYAEEYTVEQKINAVRKKLVEKDQVRFEELFDNAQNKSEAICLFLALLELIKWHEIIVVQENNRIFGNLLISRRQVTAIAAENSNPDSIN